jgi:hypothetical protein
MTENAIMLRFLCLLIFYPLGEQLTSPDPSHREAILGTPDNLAHSVNYEGSYSTITRDAELAARDAELAARDAELAARDAIIKSILLNLSLK